MSKISISYTNSLVKTDERKCLRTLPAHIKVAFQSNNDKLNLLLYPEYVKPHCCQVYWYQFLSVH